MKTENNKCNGLEHVPACSTWPPPWLTTTAPPAPSTPVAAKPKLPEPPPGVSPRDLPPELYERWEERVAIRHFDGKIPWKEAEALALADVLREKAEWNAGPAPETANAAPVVQPTLFPAEERGPYR